MKTVSGPTIAILIRITKQMGARVEHELCTPAAGVPIRRQSIILYYITVCLYSYEPAGLSAGSANPTRHFRTCFSAKLSDLTMTYSMRQRLVD